MEVEIGGKTTRQIIKHDFKKSNGVINGRFTGGKKEIVWQVYHYKVVDLLLMCYENNDFIAGDLFQENRKQIKFYYADIAKQLKVRHRKPPEFIRNVLQEISDSGFDYLKNGNYVYTRFINKIKDNYKDEPEDGRTRNFFVTIEIDEELFDEFAQLRKIGNYTLVNRNQFNLESKYSFKLYQLLKMKTSQKNPHKQQLIDEITLTLQDLNELFTPNNELKFVSLFKKHIKEAYDEIISYNLLDDIYIFQYDKRHLKILINREKLSTPEDKVEEQVDLFEKIKRLEEELKQIKKEGNR